MGDVISFGKHNGYTYFAKAVFDSLCEDVEDVSEYKIKVCDRSDFLHEIVGAHLNPEDRTVTLFIDD